MGINWKVRFKNKTWLLTMIAAIITFAYQMLGMFDIVPAISQDEVTQIVGLIMNLLVGLGVIVDPTTTGITDSTRAMSYTEPSDN